MLFRLQLISAVRCCAPVAVWLVAVLVSAGAAVRADAERTLPQAASSVINASCLDCHTGPESEAGLDLEKLSSQPLSDESVPRWVRVFDRVADGEMPPADYGALSDSDQTAFLESAGGWIRDSQREQQERFGRVRGRRLTRRELERSLHDLLGIDIPLADQLPEEAKSSGFSTVATGQSMSHFQLAAWLNVVDLALDEAWRRAFHEDDEYRIELEPREIARKNPKRRTREPEMREGLAVIWSSRLIFYGRIPATSAPEDGWYRFRVRASGLKLPETGGVWSTVRTGLCVSSAPLLPWVTAFEAVEEPRDVEFDAWLPRRHMLEIRPGDATLKMGRFQGGQVGTGEGESQDLPGVAFHHITMERVHHGPDNAGLRTLLFGEIPVELATRREPGRLQSEDPEADLRNRLQAFAARAFRRPVSDADVAPFIALAKESLDATDDLATALRVGFRAILCSPRFLYFSEEPGPLDQWAVASRISYLLTGTAPDATLRAAAESEALGTPSQLAAHVHRLLDADQGRQFIQDFAGEWLDLDQISATEPDRRLYPGFDAIVEQSMVDETQACLQTMLEENLSPGHLIDSDFTWLNSRLARYYGIPGVEGDRLQRIALQAEHRRGGILTHGSILKVTANGTTTSPVIRGVWVSERLLGQPIPPPPDNVPAIEPDIRGAETIRDMLAKHRSQPSCASCHVKIDPPGFALESYDPSGRWRDHYLAVSDRRRSRGPEVDASYALPDGRTFDDLPQFQSLVAADPRPLARNVVEKLITFGTGAPVSFADREAVEEILDQTAEDNYGMRSLLLATVTHPIFLSK